MNAKFLCFLFSGIVVIRAEAQFYNQREPFLNGNIHWTFGSNSGLTFTGGGPLSFPSEVNVLEGCASVSSAASGALLFYSDGAQVWNRNHQRMPNGTGLLGNTSGSTTQGVCIVPFVDSPGRYYLFSLDGAGTDRKLWYSVIDTSLDNGLGDVDPARRNILLDSSLSEAMIAVPGNSCDIWLLVHAFEDAVYKAYHITRAGLDVNPVISPAGNIRGRGPTVIITINIFGLVLQIPVPTGAYMAGGMSVSPNREMIALSSFVPACLVGTNTGLAGVLLCRFDAGTGRVSNGVQVDYDLQTYHAIFSPDNSRLYTTSYNLVTGFNELLQYDVSNYDSAAIAASRQHVADLPIFSEGNYFKLYNDTIYITNEKAPYLDRINRPNLPGAACSYEDSAITLWTPPGIAPLFMGLPNDVVYPSPPDTLFVRALDTLLCEDHGGLTVYAPPGFGGYLWDDGRTDSVRTLTDEGTYRVLGLDACHSRMDTFIIRTRTRDTLTVRTDTVICADGIALYYPAPPGYSSYTWDDGSGNTIREITDTGTYYLTSDTFCLTRSDTIIVRPEAISYTYSDRDTTLCSNEALILLSAPAGYASYLWDDGTSDTVHAATMPGKYYVVSRISCHARTDSFSVHGVNVDFTLGEDTVICNGAPLALHVPLAGAAYLWQDGSRSQTFTVTESGVYHVTVDREHCRSADTVRVTYHHLSPDIGADRSVCRDEPVSVLLSLDTAAYDIVRWQDGSRGGMMQVTDTGVYIVTVTLPPCSASDTVRVTYELCRCHVEVPSAFTPNGDGKNDVFRPVTEAGCPVTRYALYIYNRWGQRVYAHAGTDVTEGWDGTWQGLPAGAGTYMYYMELEAGTRPEQYRRQGDVSLIR